MKIGKTLSELENMMSLLTGKSTPGTFLSREMHEGVMGWCLGLGPVGEPKVFWHGRTIQEALCKARDDLNEDVKEMSGVGGVSEVLKDLRRKAVALMGEDVSVGVTCQKDSYGKEIVWKLSLGPSSQSKKDWYAPTLRCAIRKAQQDVDEDLKAIA